MCRPLALTCQPARSGLDPCEWLDSMTLWHLSSKFWGSARRASRRCIAWEVGPSVPEASYANRPSPSATVIGSESNLAVFSSDSTSALRPGNDLNTTGPNDRFGLCGGDCLRINPQDFLADHQPLENELLR